MLKMVLFHKETKDFLNCLNLSAVKGILKSDYFSVGGILSTFQNSELYKVIIWWLLKLLAYDHDFNRQLLNHIYKSFKKHKGNISFVCLFFTVVLYVYLPGLLLSGYAQFTSACSFASVTTAVTLWCRLTSIISFLFPRSIRTWLCCIFDAPVMNPFP